MTPVTPAVLTLALLFTSSVSQQSATTNPQATTPGAGVVTLIGCVERSPVPPGTQGSTPVTYKLIDVQPGPGTRMGLQTGSQFLLASAKSLTTPIDLVKFQNQRVELTGTVSPAPPATVNPVTKPGEKIAEPLPTFTITSLKSVSTECK